MKIFDDSKKLIDAEISVDTDNTMHRIIVESSGGASKEGRPRRNPEYNKAVSKILSRIQQAGTNINGIYLDTDKTKKMGLSLEERLVYIDKNEYPISASSIEPETLRKAIGRTVSKMAQAPGVKTNGNAQKRILIEIQRDKNNSVNFSSIIKGAIVTSFDSIEFEACEPSFDHNQVEDQRTIQLRAITARKGQAKFRQKLIDAYNGKCAVTNSSALPVLEAAHIIPYNGELTNHPNNGLLLRADVHTLFDCGFLSITDEYKIQISEVLKNTEYWQYNKRKLHLPQKESLFPSKGALEVRRNDSKI